MTLCSMQLSASHLDFKRIFGLPFCHLADLYSNDVFFVVQDGFVLVGSVSGQRYWSSLLPASDSGSVITAATWTPDDQQVYLGTSQVGQICWLAFGVQFHLL